MDNNSVTQSIVTTINYIFEQIIGSVDNNLYTSLDKMTFIGPDILKDNYFEKILGTSTTNGILMISNSLLLGILLYYSIKYLLSHFTYSEIESPKQFIFKLIVCGICMNFSYFLMEQFLNIIYYISVGIKTVGENIFQKNISFSSLILSINSVLFVNSLSLNIFSMDGILKGTITFSLLHLVLSYAFRYIMLKVFILLTPFAILSLSMKNTAWFFRTWIKNIFSLLLIQIIIALVLLILFSTDYSSGNLLSKFIYVGGIYALIKTNSIVRDFIGGISTNV